MGLQLFKKKQYVKVSVKKTIAEGLAAAESQAPSSDQLQCPQCGKVIDKEELGSLSWICPDCDKHFRMTPDQRIELLVDQGTFERWQWQASDWNPLQYPDYEEKRLKAQAQSQACEGVCCGLGTIQGTEAVIILMNSAFMMGSMGSYVGEVITQAIEKATALKKSVVMVTASGGARMQEGIFSLMQMAKTSGALKRHEEAGLFSLVVLTDPTTGGVTASFAMLGDVIIAEPKALIGFAGPRVIEQTLRQSLPEGFQQAEFLLAHGLIDDVVHRKQLKTYIGKLLLWHGGKRDGKNNGKSN